MYQIERICKTITSTKDNLLGLATGHMSEKKSLLLDSKLNSLLLSSIHLEDIWHSLACQMAEETGLQSWVIGFYKELEQVDALNKTSDALYKHNPWTKSPIPIVFKVLWSWNKKESTLKWTKIFVLSNRETHLWGWHGN